MFNKADNEIREEHSLKEFLPLLKVILENDGLFKLYPKGTSMLPLLRQHKDAVVLKKRHKILKKGDIVLYQREDGCVVLHRIVKDINGQYYLCGDHQISPEKNIREEQVIANIKYIYRKNKKIKICNWKLRVYAFFWQSVFVRKCYLKIEEMWKWI